MEIYSGLTRGIAAAGAAAAEAIRKTVSGTCRYLRKQEKAIAKTAICTAAAGAMLCWWGNEFSARYDRNQRAISAISTERAAETLEKIITEELDGLKRAGGSLRNHRTALRAQTSGDLAGAREEASKIESAGAEIFHREIEPGLKKERLRPYAPIPRTGIGEKHADNMLHKLIFPFIFFGMAGALIAQTRIWYREMIKAKRFVGKAARWCAMAGLISMMPYLPRIGIDLYRQTRPIKNHYAAQFNEINVSAGSCRVTTPQDIALALYHENIHARQSRAEDQQFVMNNIFTEGEARMREMAMAKTLTAKTGEAAYIESSMSRAIPELVGAYIAACQASRHLPDHALLIRTCQEAGPRLEISLDAHTAGTAVYMLAMRNEGAGIVDRASKREYDKIIDAAERRK